MGYDKAKIYKLECEDGHYYYGSTINELRVRLSGHKQASAFRPYRVYQHINEIGWEKVKIILVEAYPCETRADLNRKENEYISLNKSNPLCLNNNLACLTDEQRCAYKRQHTEDHKEELAEYHRKKRSGNAEVAAYQRQYREANREKLLEQKRQDYLAHKEERDAKNRERYYANRDAILARKREKHASKTPVEST
jgi:predicted GIY-YIG superfamily endonuclease